jgi:hypothetical protein
LSRSLSKHWNSLQKAMTCGYGAGGG